MPGGKKDILETGGNASDFNAIVEGGDQPYLLGISDAYKKYNTKFSSPGDFENWYHDIEQNYNKYNYDTYMNAVRATTPVPYKGNSYYGSKKTPVNADDFIYNVDVTDDYEGNPYYRKADKTLGKTAEIDPLLPTSTYEDPVYGKMFAQYERGKSPNNVELMSVLGSKGMYSSYLGSALRSLWNVAVPSVISGVGSATEVADDLWDGMINGYDKQSSADVFGRKLQEFAKQISAPINVDESEAPFSNANAFVYNVVNGLGSVAQAVGASYLGGYGSKLLGGGIMAQTAASQKWGVGVGAMVMGDAFRQQAKMAGISDIDSAYLYPIIAGATVASETWFGPNVFTDAYAKTAANSVELNNVIANSFKIGRERLGKSANESLTRAEAGILFRDAAKDVSKNAIERFKKSGASIASGFIEEGSEEVFEQLLQNGAEMAYDSYKKNTEGFDPYNSKGLFGVKSLTEGAFDSFILGGISGGIAGGLMGMHRNNVLAGYWASGQEDKVKETADYMYQNKLLASDKHDINGNVLTENENGEMGESLNDIAYKALRQQFGLYDTLKKSYNVTDTDQMELIAGHDDKAQGIVSELFMRAALKSELSNKKNAYQEELKTLNPDTDAVKVADLNNKITAIDSSIAQQQNKIDYIQKGYLKNDRIVNASLYQKGLLEKFGPNSGIHLREWHDDLNAFLEHQKSITDKNLEEFNNYKDKEENDFVTNLNSIKEFNQDSESYLNALMKKVFDYGGLELGYTMSKGQEAVKRLLDNYEQVPDSSHPDGEVTLPKVRKEEVKNDKIMSPEEEEVYNKLNKYKQDLENNENSQGDLKLNYSNQDRQNDIDNFPFIYKDTSLVQEGSNEPVVRYIDIRSKIDELLNAPEGQLSNIDNENFLEGVLNNANTGKISLSQTTIEMIQEGLTGLRPSLYYDEQDGAQLQENDLPLYEDKGYAKSILDNFEELKTQVKDLKNKIAQEKGSRLLRQKRITRNDILNTFLILKKFNDAFYTVKNEPLQRKWTKELQEFVAIINKGGKTEATPDLINAIGDNDWKDLTVQYYKLIDAASEMFEKVAGLKEYIHKVIATIDPDATVGYLGGSLDPLMSIDKESVLTYSNLRANKFSSYAQVDSYKRYIISVIAPIIRMKPSSFLATYNDYLKKLDAKGVVPTDEQKRVIYHAVSFYQSVINEQNDGFLPKTKIDTIVDNILGITGYAGTGKSAVVIKLTIELIKKITPDVKIMTVTPNSIIDETIGSTVELKVSNAEFLSDLKNNKTDSYKDINMIVIDEAHSLTTEQIDLLKAYALDNPKKVVFIVYDTLQAMTLKDGRIFMGASRISENTIPLTEVYRSGYLDIWKLQDYYRGKALGRPGYSIPPSFTYKNSTREGVQISSGLTSEDKDKFINDFKMVVDAMDPNMGECCYLVYSDEQRKQLIDKSVNPLAPLSGKYADYVFIVKPTEDDFGVGGQSLSNVWVDSTGVEDVLLTNMLLTGSTRAIKYAHVLDNEAIAIKPNLSTQGIPIQYNSELEKSDEKKSDIIALNDIILKATIGTVINPVVLNPVVTTGNGPVSPVLTKEKTEALVEEIKGNANFIKVSADEKNYIKIDINDPAKPIIKTYKRVTSVADPTKTGAPATNVVAYGNIVDELIRDLFSAQYKGDDYYKSFTSIETLKHIKGQLGNVYKQITANGEKVAAKGIVLYNDDMSVAGTIDILTYTDDGKFKIYDVKTMRGDYFKDTDSTGVRKLESVKYGMSYSEYWTNQLSLYRMLLYNTYGVLAETAIIPIQMEYDIKNTARIYAENINVFNPTPFVAKDSLYGYTLIAPAAPAAPIINVPIPVVKKVATVFEKYANERKTNTEHVYPKHSLSVTPITTQTYNDGTSSVRINKDDTYFVDDTYIDDGITYLKLKGIENILIPAEMFDRPVIINTDDDVINSDENVVDSDIYLSDKSALRFEERGELPIIGFNNPIKENNTDSANIENEFRLHLISTVLSKKMPTKLVAVRSVGKINNIIQLRVSDYNFAIVSAEYAAIRNINPDILANLNSLGSLVLPEIIVVKPVENQNFYKYKSLENPSMYSREEYEKTLINSLALLSNEAMAPEKKAVIIKYQLAKYDIFINAISVLKSDPSIAFADITNVSYNNSSPVTQGARIVYTKKGDEKRSMVLSELLKTIAEKKPFLYTEGFKMIPYEGGGGFRPVYRVSYVNNPDAFVNIDIKLTNLSNETKLKAIKEIAMKPSAIWDGLFWHILNNSYPLLVVKNKGEDFVVKKLQDFIHLSNSGKLVLNDRDKNGVTLTSKKQESLINKFFAALEKEKIVLREPLIWEGKTIDSDSYIGKVTTHAKDVYFPLIYPQIHIKSDVVQEPEQEEEGENPSISSNRVEDVDNTNERRLNKSSVVKRLIEIFGEKAVKERVFFTPFLYDQQSGRDLLGNVTNGVMNLQESIEGVTEKSPYHESIHFVFQNFIPQNEAKQYYDAMRERIGDKDISDKDVEERIALLAQEKPLKNLPAILRKMLNALKKIVYTFKRNKDLIDDLMHKIDTGYWKDKPMRAFATNIDTDASVLANRVRGNKSVNKNLENELSLDYSDYEYLHKIFSNDAHFLNKINNKLKAAFFYRSSYNKRVFENPITPFEAIVKTHEMYVAKKIRTDKNIKTARLNDIVYSSTFISPEIITSKFIDNDILNTYIDTQLANPDVFYRFFKHIFPLVDFVKMQYEDAIDLTEELEDSFGDYLISDNNSTNAHNAIAAHTNLVLSKMNKAEVGVRTNVSSQYVNMQLLAAELTNIAIKVKQYENTNNFHEGMRDEIRSLIDAVDDDTQLSYNLRAVYNELYKKDEDIASNLFHAARMDEHPQKAGAFFKEITQKRLSEMKDGDWFKALFLGFSDYLSKMSNLQFATSTDIEQAFLNLVNKYAVDSSYLESADALTRMEFNIKQIEYIEKFNRNYLDKRKSAFATLSSLKTHFGSLINNQYGRFVLKKRNYKDSFRLEKPSSSTIDDVKTKLIKGIKSKFLTSIDGVTYTINEDKAEALTGEYKSYSVESDGVYKVVDGKKEQILSIDTSGQYMSFKFNDKFIGLRNNAIGRERSIELRNAFRFFGLSLEKTTINAFLNNKKEVFRDTDALWRESTPRDTLAQTLGLMFVSAQSAVHENPTNLSTGPKNIWWEHLNKIKNILPISNDTNYSNDDIDNTGVADNTNDDEEVEVSKYFTPADFFWNISQLAAVESFNRNYGYNKKYYSVTDSVMYPQVYSSSTSDIIGNNIGLNSTRFIGKKFYQIAIQNPSHPAVSYTDGKMYPLIPFLAYKDNITSFVNPIQQSIVSTTILDGATSNYKGVKINELSNNDFIRCNIDSYITSVIENNNRSKKSGWNFNVPGHTVSDKIHLHNYKIESSLVYPMSPSKKDDKTVWDINKDYIIKNADNLFRYHENLRVQAMDKWITVIEQTFGIKYTSNEKSDLIDASLSDVTNFIAFLNNSLNTIPSAAKITKAQFNAKILNSDLELNYHYKINKDGDVVVDNPGFLQLKSNWNGSALEDTSMYGQLNYQAYKAVADDDRYDWLINNVYHELLTDFTEYINKNSNKQEDGGYYFTSEIDNGFSVNKTTGENTNKFRNSNSFIDSFALSYHFNDMYVSGVILGKPGEFKSAKDFFKRSQGPSAPGSVVDNDNPFGIAKTMNVAIMNFDRKIFLDSLSIISQESAEEFSDDWLNGGAIINPLTHMLLLESAGPGSSIVPRNGMGKPVSHDFNLESYQGLYLKYAFLAPSEGLYKNSSFIRNIIQKMLDVDLPTSTGSVNYYNEFIRNYENNILNNNPDAWNNALGEVLNLVRANNHRASLIDQVIDLTAVKQGATRINRMDQDGPIRTVTLDTNKLRFQLNAEKKTQNETMKIASQIIAEQAINNIEQHTVISEAMAELVNNMMDYVRGQLDEIKSSIKGSSRDASLALLRKIGLDSITAGAEVDNLLAMLMDKDVSPEFGFVRFKLMQYFINNFNDAIKPDFSGTRANQWADIFEIYEDKFGNAYLTEDLKRLTQVQRDALGITNQTQSRELKHYRFYDSTGRELFEEADRKNIVRIRPAEIVIPFTMIEKYGVSVNDTLHEYLIMDDGFTLETEDSGKKMGVRFLEWFVNRQDKDISKLRVYSAIMNSRLLYLQRLKLKNKSLENMSYRNNQQQTLLDKLNTEIAEFTSKMSEVTVEDIVKWYNYFERTLTVFSGRVPAPGTSSGFVGKVVGWANDVSNTVFIPTSNNILNNADFDIDQLSIYVLDDDFFAFESDKKPIWKRNKELKNIILENIMDYYSKAKNMDMFLMPLSLKKFEQKIDLVLERNNRYSNKDESNDTEYSPTASWKYRYEAVQGRASTSIFANAIKAYSILYTASVKTPGAFSANFQVSKSGLDEKNSFIMEFLGQLVQASVDNAKEVLLGRWLANKQNANIIASLAIRGYTAESIMRYIVSNPISFFFESVANENKISQAAPDKVEKLNRWIEAARDKYVKAVQANISVLGNYADSSVLENEKVLFSKKPEFYKYNQYTKKLEKHEVIKIENGTVTAKKSIFIDADKLDTDAYLSMQVDSYFDSIEDESQVASVSADESNNNTYQARLTYFLNSVSAGYNENYNTPYSSEQKIIAYTGLDFEGRPVKNGMPGLMELLRQSEQMFRLTSILGANQGLSVFEFELNTYINNATFSIGKNIKDFLQGSGNYYEWQKMRGSWLSDVGYNKWLDNENAIRDCFNIGEIINANPYYVSILRVADFLRDFTEKTFIDSRPEVKQVAIDFYNSINKDPFTWKNEFVDYDVEFQQFIRSIHLNISEDRNVVLDENSFDLSNRVDQSNFIKYFPIWFDQWKNNYEEKLSKTGKSLPNVLVNMIEIPSTYLTYIGMTGEYENPDIVDNYMSEFKEINDPEFKRNLFLYDLLLKGTGITKNSLKKLFNTSIFHSYSKTLDIISNSLDKNTPITLNDGTSMLFIDMLKKSFIPTLAATKFSLLDSISNALETAGADNESSVPINTIHMPMHVIETKTYPKVSFVPKKYSSIYDVNKGIFIPQQSRYETNFRYDPVDSGIINIPVDIEDANDDEIVGVLKYLSYDNLMKLKKFGSLVVKQGSSKAIIHDGLTIINDTVYKVKKKSSGVHIQLAKNPVKMSLPIPGTKENLLGIKEASVLVRFLKKAFPFIEVKWFSDIDLAKLGVPSGTKGYLNNGVVYLNQDKMSADTPMHEFGHIISQVLKYYNPVMHNAIMSKVYADVDIINLMKGNSYYSKYSDSDLADEAFSFLLGMKFSDYANNILNELQRASILSKIGDLISNAFKNFIGYLKSGLGITGKSYFDKLNVDTATLDNIITTIVNDVVSGKAKLYLSSKDKSLITDMKKFSVVLPTLESASDLNNYLLDTKGHSDEELTVTRIAENFALRGLNADGLYNYTLPNGEYITIDPKNLFSEISTKIVQVLDAMDTKTNDLVAGWIKSNNGISPVYSDSSTQLKQHIDYNQYTDELFTLGSDSFNQFCAVKGITEFADKVKTTIKGRTPVIVFHGAKSGDIKEFSLIDISSGSIGTNNENNVLNQFVSELQASKFGVMLKLNKGGVYGINLGIIAMELKKAIPAIAPRNIEVIGRLGNQLIHTSFPMVDLIRQFKAMGKVNSFVSSLSSDLKSYFTDESNFDVEKWDHNYIASLTNYYKAEIERLESEKDTLIKAEKDSSVASQINYAYTGYIGTIQKSLSPLTEYNETADTAKLLKKQVKSRLAYLSRTIDAKLLTKEKEYLFLSGVLFQMDNANIGGRNSMATKLNDIELQMKGNHNANNDIVQWAYRETLTGIRWIIDTYNEFNKVHRSYVKNVILAYEELNPENKYEKIFIDRSQEPFKRLIRWLTLEDKNGAQHMVNSGNYHWTLSDPETKSLYEQKILTDDDLAYADYLNKHIKNILIQSFIHSNGYDKTNEEHIKQATEKVESFWQPGMLPIMRGTTMNKFFRGSITSAVNDWGKSYSRSNELFDFLGDEDKNALEVLDRFKGSWLPTKRNQMLGLSIDPITNKNIVDDISVNQDVDYNIERIIDYFTLSSIRKVKMDDDVIPKMNAAKQILLSYNNSQYSEGTPYHHKWIEFLDLMSDRLIHAKRNHLEASVKLGGYTFKIEDSINTVKTLSTWAGISYSIPLAVNSFASNLLQIVTNSVANSVAGTKLFGPKEVAEAMAICSSDFPFVIALINKFQLVNMDESTLLHDRRFKESDIGMFQTSWMYWMNYQTDFAARAVCAIAQIIKDGSIDAYSLSEDKTILYDQSKDKKFEGSKGKALEEQIRLSLFNDGFMDSIDSKLPYGYDWKEIEAIKGFSDKYVIGGMDSTTYRNLGYKVIGSIFMQFRSYLPDKFENMFAASYQSDIMGSYKVIKTKEGIEKAIWQKEVIEGKIQSLISAIAMLKDSSTMGMTAFDNMTDFQKRNLVKLGSDLILFATLYMTLSSALNPDKDDEESDFSKWTKGGTASIKRLINYSINDLVTEWQLNNIAKNPIPSYTFMSRIANLTMALIQLDTKNVWKNFTRVSPGGATYRLISDAFADSKTNN